MEFDADFKEDFRVFKKIIDSSLLNKEDAKTLTGIFLNYASDFVGDEKDEDNLHRRVLRAVYNKYPELKCNEERGKNDSPIQKSQMR